MKPLREILNGLSHRKGLRKIDLRQDDFLSSISDRPGRKPLLNLCTLLALSVCCFVFVIYTAIFLIHDVILFRKDITISRAGALMPKKACDCEQAVYLFNTSELWADTGIQVREGDCIKVSASGAFQSSLTELAEAAQSNRIPRYPWIGNVQRQTWQKEGPDSSLYVHMQEGQKYCVDRNARFGAILYQIRTDGEPCLSDWNEIEKKAGHISGKERNSGLDGIDGTVARSGPDMGIRQLTYAQGENFHIVDRNGTLYFAVNDIYLNDKVLDMYEQANIKALRAWKKAHPQTAVDPQSEAPITDTALIRKLRENNIFQLFYHKISGDKSFKEGLYFRGETFHNFFKNNRKAWYNDNLGQIAITVDIQRRIPNRFISHKNWYRMLENQLNKAIDGKPQTVQWFLLIVKFFLLFLTVFLLTSVVACIGPYLILAPVLLLCDYLFRFLLIVSTALFRLRH